MGPDLSESLILLAAACLALATPLKIFNAVQYNHGDVIVIVPLITITSPRGKSKALAAALQNCALPTSLGKVVVVDIYHGLDTCKPHGIPPCLHAFNFFADCLFKQSE